jgi:hypothetical protein
VKCLYISPLTCLNFYIDGDIDDRLRNIMKAFGLRMVHWNVLSDDTYLSATDKEVTPPPGANVVNDGPPVPNNWHIYNIVGRYEKVLSQKFQTGLDWMKPVPFQGFVSLAHELYPSTVLASQQVIPLIQKANFNFVNVATCDKTVNAPIQNGDLYLPDSAPLSQFIKSIKLPMDASGFVSNSSNANGVPSVGKDSNPTSTISNSTPSTPTVTIPSGASRILDQTFYAFFILLVVVLN